MDAKRLMGCLGPIIGLVVTLFMMVLVRTLMREPDGYIYRGIVVFYCMFLGVYWLIRYMRRTTKELLGEEVEESASEECGDEVEDIEDEEDRLGDYVCMDKKGVIHTTLDCGNIDTNAIPIPTEGLTHEVLAEHMMANYVFGEPAYCPECFPQEWQRELEERMETKRKNE